MSAAAKLELLQPPACAPLVKWVGGKTALLPEIRKMFPRTWGRYFEPFAGGAARFFDLAMPGMVLGDFNADLMHTYRMVAREPEAVIRRLRFMERKHRLGGEDLYYETREQWNAGLAMRVLGVPGGWTDVQRAAAFLYLNRTCWNGVWRVNRRGDFNVPSGKYRNPTICDPERIRAASAVLAHATLRTGSWSLTIADAQPGDVIYFDPPYVPASTTSNFTTYVAGGFGAAQQAELAAAFRLLADAGVTVIASNSDTKLVRQLYRGMKMRRVRMSRSINCKGDGRGDVGELLIRGGP